MMVASNTWLADLTRLELPEDRDWLDRNSIVIDVGTEPLYESEDV